MNPDWREIPLRLHENAIFNEKILNIISQGKSKILKQQAFGIQKSRICT